MTNATASDWKAKAAALSIQGQAFIDGEFVAAASGETRPCVNPATGQNLADVAACGSADAERAVAAARAAFESGVWSQAAPAERKRTLLRFAELIAANADEVGLLVSLEMGKLVDVAVNLEVPLAADIMQWNAEAIDKVYGEIAPTGPGDLALVTREPLGVVVAIVPWNFPVSIGGWKIAPALAAGNSVVLKPASASPLSALKLAELGAEAGIPAGVLNVLPGPAGQVGEPLGIHPEVDCLAFTGSPEVGRRLLRYAADSNLKDVWLELGGKSPNLVFADVEDIDLAAQWTAMGIFFNQGEVCSANSRLLVERSIKDEFVAKVVENAAAIRPGDPLDPDSTMGAMVDDGHTREVLGHIERAREQGAELRHGGQRVSLDGSDCFLEPTVFDAVAPGSDLHQKEVFGPVLAITPFDTEQEAIEIANGTEYGLAASIWTSSLSRTHRVAPRLQAGTVSVNTIDAMSPMTPFGGVKTSGNGRDLSLHALEKFTALKTTWIKY